MLSSHDFAASRVGKILVVGSANTDMVVRVPRLPGAGETVLGGSFLSAAGGKGANQAVAAARAGGDVALVACLGRDALGDAALAGYADEGIDTTGVLRVAEVPSGVALIGVDDEGQNAIMVASGANAHLSPEHVCASGALFDGASVVLLQQEIPSETVQAAVDEAREHGCRVVLNPAPARSVPDALLKHVDVLTPNESEAAQLTSHPVRDTEGACRAAEALLGRGARAVVVTLGARGAVVAQATSCEHVPAHPVTAVDTTAAGDVFNGALAVALAEGQALLPAVRFASVAAALSVTRAGAQPSIPRRPAIDHFLATPEP